MIRTATQLKAKVRNLSGGDSKKAQTLIRNFVMENIYLGTGPVPFPEHKIQEKTIDWLRQNAKDMSFQGLEDDIRYNCSIIPFSFSSAGRDWNVIWQEGLLFKNTGAEEVSITVNEDEFFEIWSDLRNSGIAIKGEAGSPGRLVLDLLLSLGFSVCRTLPVPLARL